MKFSADRLKNINWKQFAVNHGEKIALGVVGLMVVLILFMGTRWSTFKEKDPNQLISEVEEQSKVLVSEPWPEAEREAYTDKYDVNIVYDNTYSVVKADKFRYPPGHPMIWPLHRRQEPIEEPKWLAVQELIQTPGRFIIELPPEGQEPLADAAEAIAKEAEKDKNLTSREKALQADFDKKSQTPGMGPMDGLNPYGSNPYGTNPYGNEDPMAGGDAGEEMMMDYYGTGGEYGGVSPGIEINARGVRFMAVRGLFPFREQVEKVMKARNDMSLQNARMLVHFANFEIQRQKAKPGPEPWSEDENAWTTLDQKVALDVLAETINYAQEIVDPINTNYVITSPLPARLVGRWSAYYVGHSPKIPTLTETQLELRRVLDEQLVKMKQQASAADPSGIGGFAFAQRDMLGIQNEVVGNTSQYQSLMSSMSQMYSSADGGESQMPGEMEGMLRSTEETPEYLLFRYFDFEVEPGVAYRYRVRLKLFNPNFNELPDNLAAENVGTGEFRDTPWSEPTPVPTDREILDDDAKFFVGDVLAARGRQEPKAKIDLYQWLSEIGTRANKIVEVQVGQFIGQSKAEVDEEGELRNKNDSLAVEVLRPYQSFKKEGVELGTNDAVVDLAAPPTTLRASNRDFHADLKVRELKPLSQVLVVNEYGELEQHDPITRSEQHAQAREILKMEHEPWENLKNMQTQPLEGEMEGDAGGFIDYYGMGGAAGRGGASGRGGSAGRGGAAGRGGSAGMSSAAGPMGPRRSGANPGRRNRSFNPMSP